jgi:hypothetical protein
MTPSSPRQTLAGGEHDRPGRIKSVVLQVIGWLLIAEAVLAWANILPGTLHEFEGFGIELGIVTAYILVFAFLYFLGTLLLLAALGKKSPIAWTIAAIGVAMLIAIVVTAQMRALPAK